MVVWFGEQAGDGVLSEPGGIAVLTLLGEAEEDERVVREGVAHFAQSTGFHLLIRPVEYFADAAADEIGDGDSEKEGWMWRVNGSPLHHQRSRRFISVAVETGANYDSQIARP